MSHKLNSFECFLHDQGPRYAVNHMIECLKSSRGELAWELMERVRGPNWSCPPEEFAEYVLETLEMLYAGDLYQDEDYDPTPWCSHCGAMKRSQCDCGPIPEND
jgi:hypothetical protein